jgi:hypothetical protein
MQDLLIVCIVDVCEDAKELPVDMLNGRREGVMEILVWER